MNCDEKLKTKTISFQKFEKLGVTTTQKEKITSSSQYEVCANGISFKESKQIVKECITSIKSFSEPYEDQTFSQKCCQNLSNTIFSNTEEECDELCFVADERVIYDHASTSPAGLSKCGSVNTDSPKIQEKSNNKSKNSCASSVKQCFNSGELKKPKTSQNNTEDESQTNKNVQIQNKSDFLSSKYSADEIALPERFLRKCGCASVMIVDDSPFNLLILNEIFSKIIPPMYTYKSGEKDVKFKIDEASNGKQALNKVKETISKTCCRGYELILMDLSMPIMDGPTSARHIVQLQKEKKVGKHLKIVAVTAYDSPEHKALCRSSGMKGFLNKPISIQNVQGCLLDE